MSEPKTRVLKLNRIEWAFMVALVIFGIPAVFFNVVVIVMVLTGTARW